jgi:type I restriction enzyme, S subunit
MVESFKTSTLIDRGALAIGDGYRAKNSELSSTGIPFARAANINSGFQFSDADRFPIEDLGKCGSKISQPGDVVFTSKGSVGRFAFVSSITEQFVYSPQLCFWRSLDSEVIDPVWLYYWMYGPEFQNQIGYLKTQTDMAEYVSLRDQRAMSITLPPVTQQRAMAAPLLLLDRKVNLNRQTARTLEELAQRLFKSWFVDFDPVRAKMAGRQPAHTPPEIADLFPDRLVDSPLGPIPEGWEIKPIESIVTIKGGATPSTREKAFWDGGTYHWATPKDLSGLQQKVLITTDRKITSAGVERISSGQLPPGTVLMSSRAPVGYLALADMPVSVNQGFIAMICDQGVPNTFVLHWAEANMDVIKSNAGGSTFAEISMKQFRPLEVIVPPEQLVRAFDEMATDWFQRVSQLARQNVTLAQLRDRLLPKLISGEIRVPEHAG